MNTYVLLLIVCCLVVANGFVFPQGVPMKRQHMVSTKLELQTGRVKFFDSTKGFGFITPDNGGEDIFVHQTAIFAQGFRSLGEGESVEFEINEDQVRGKKFATNVTGPNGSPVQGAPRPPRDEYARY